MIHVVDQLPVIVNVHWAGGEQAARFKRLNLQPACKARRSAPQTIRPPRPTSHPTHAQQLREAPRESTQPSRPGASCAGIFTPTAFISRAHATFLMQTVEFQPL